MVVCDSAPIIHLSRVGRLDLLRDLFPETVISASVYREVVTEARRLHKPGVSTIEGALKEGWMKVVEARQKQAIAKLSKDERIEVEDAEVISLARELSEVLVSSDAWLAKVAKAVGVRVVWTTTLVLMARRQGLLGSGDARALLRDLVSSGLYLRTDVYAALMDAIETL